MKKLSILALFSTLLACQSKTEQNTDSTHTVTAPESAITKSYCNIKQINADSTIEVDMIDFLQGDAAIEAARKNGEAIPDVSAKGDTTYSVANDYYIVNDSKEITKLSLDKNLVLDVYNEDMDGKKADATLEFVKKHLKFGVFILHLKDGKVVKIEEQFIP
ncbi:MAG: hypothetical protein MUF45_01555 [Spirosomaceae bacterium]|jgi:hypothetical protein|nr:hypothetical protein [Spirosomataceae bacterium]